MNSKSKKPKKSQKLDKHLEYSIDCHLNETKDSKTDKIRSKIFHLNATKDHFNSQKAFDKKRLQLMTQLTHELDKSDGKNTYLSEDLIKWTSDGRTDRSFAHFDSHLYDLSEDQICQQLGLNKDMNYSDDCQVIAVVRPHKRSPDIQTTDKERTDMSEVQQKRNIFNTLGYFRSGLPESKNSDKSSSNASTSKSSPNKVSGLFRPTDSPKSNKRQKSFDCEENVPKKTTFITGLEKKVVEDLRKGSVDMDCARKTLNKVRGFRPPLKDNEQKKCFPSANESDSEVDHNLKNIDKTLIERIESEIITQLDAIDWEDVAGLDFAKKEINLLAIRPLQNPEMFTGLRAPAKGLLLFGPPGTGKTFLGRLIASKSKATFFSITVSALNSKWIGEGEKMVRAMFAVARARQPSVIFIDEIDSLLTTRCDTEHESSRRMKTEFFTQFQGVTTASVDRILLIGATNRPQDLDKAAIRRLPARLYIPLPDESARIQMITNCLRNEAHDLTEQEIRVLAQKTNGYSGADMRELCRESAMEALRDMDSSMDESGLQIRGITYKDFLINLETVKPTIRVEDLQQYEEWDREYGTQRRKKA